MIENGEEMRDN